MLKIQYSPQFPSYIGVMPRDGIYYWSLLHIFVLWSFPFSSTLVFGVFPFLYQIFVYIFVFCHSRYSSSHRIFLQKIRRKTYFQINGSTLWMVSARKRLQLLRWPPTSVRWVVAEDLLGNLLGLQHRVLLLPLLLLSGLLLRGHLLALRVWLYILYGRKRSNLYKGMIL